MDSSYLGNLIADKMQQVKNYGNQYEVDKHVPLFGGTGVGSLFMGEAPELTKDIANKGLGALFTPEYAASQMREGPMGALDYIDHRVPDLAMVGADAVGALGAGLKGFGSLSRTAWDRAVNGATDVSRRDFMKKAGAVAGGAAIAGAGMNRFLKTGAKDVAETAAPKAVEKSTIAGSHKFNTLNDYLTHTWDEASKQVEKDWETNPGNPAEWHDAIEFEMEKRLQKDEDLYRNHSYRRALGQRTDQEMETMFSPHAKRQMKWQKKKVKEINDYEKATGTGMNGERDWKWDLILGRDTPWPHQ